MDLEATRKLAAQRSGAALSAEAHAWLMKHGLLTANDIGSLLELDHPARHVLRWQRQRKLIGLPIAQGNLYPAFQFDPERKRLRPEVARLNAMAGTGADPWEQLERWAASERARDDTPQR